MGGLILLHQASQIGTILDRVMMLSDLELETDEYAKLPSGMVLNPPDLGILIFVDGIPPNGVLVHTCTFSFLAFCDNRV